MFNQTKFIQMEYFFLFPLTFIILFLLKFYSFFFVTLIIYFRQITRVFRPSHHRTSTKQKKKNQVRIVIMAHCQFRIALWYTTNCNRRPGICWFFWENDPINLLFSQSFYDLIYCEVDLYNYSTLVLWQLTLNSVINLI